MLWRADRYVNQRASLRLRVLRLGLVEDGIGMSREAFFQAEKQPSLGFFLDRVVDRLET
jgi:hypothetical protein